MPAASRMPRLYCAALVAAALLGAPPAARADTLTADARKVLDWAQANDDAQGRPFAVVDKKAATLYVFAASGKLLGTTPALLGLARGDHSVPGIGQRPLSQIKPHERTTPSGRYASEPGRNLAGEHVVWFDYDEGLAIHRLRPGASLLRREKQLATPSPRDNRASLGCVVVPGSFYDRVVRPVLGTGDGVVYVLPETRPLATLFRKRSAQAAEH